MSYWIVEWEFAMRRAAPTWKPVDRPPFTSQEAAEKYRQRDGFIYRIREYIPVAEEPK